MRFSTLRTYSYWLLDNMPTVFTFAVGYVECEIAGTILDSKVNQLQILLLAEMVIQIDVSSRTTVRILISLSAMKDELIQNRGVIVGVVEIAVIQVLVIGNPITLLRFPLGFEEMIYPGNLLD